MQNNIADDKIMNLQAFRLTYLLSKELFSWPIFETGVQMYEPFYFCQNYFSDFQFFNIQSAIHSGVINL